MVRIMEFPAARQGRTPRSGTDLRLRLEQRCTSDWVKFPYGSRDEPAIMLRLWLRYIYDYMELPAADRTPTYEYIHGYVTSTYGYALEPCTLPGAKVFVMLSLAAYALSFSLYAGGTRFRHRCSSLRPSFPSSALPGID